MTDSRLPPHAKSMQIELTVMPQLVQARCKADDWTGIKDAAARRRAQTRLNTRAYRKRKAIAARMEEGEADTISVSKKRPEPKVNCWDVTQNSVTTASVSRARLSYDSRKPLFPMSVQAGKSQSVVMFPLCPDHLITLLQYNVFRALQVNCELVTGVAPTPGECYGEDASVISIYPKSPELLPPALLPTKLQQTVPHGGWIDIFPSSEGRDFLIQVSGTFDEDDFWADCIGGLYEGFPDDEIERRGIMAWSPPWDISGWELSEGCIKKWGWLFKHMPGLLEATNRWRRERGEDPLDWH